MGKLRLSTRQGPGQVVALRQGMDLPTRGVMQSLGLVGQGLVCLSAWGVALLPGVVMVGQPSNKQLQRAMQVVGDGKGAGRWWLRLDRAIEEGSQLRRGMMGGTEVVLDQPTVKDVLEAMPRMAGQAQERRATGVRGVGQPGASQSAGQSFILQRLDATKASVGDGAGVGFTRDPGSGDEPWVIRFLAGGQGRAAVSSPQAVGFEKLSGQVQKQLQHIKAVLEKQTGWVAEIEFVIVGGKVFVNRLERARLSAEAAVKVAVQMAQSGVIEETQAIDQVEPSMLGQLLLPQFEAKARSKAKVLAQGFAASPGVAVGRLVFSAGEALRRGSAGEAVILVQPETYAQDVAGMRVCQGVLTSSGGMTSHAAVVARGWGLCAVVGASGVHIDRKRGQMRVGERVLTSADTISLDGATGEVLAGAVKVKAPSVQGHVQSLLTWADARRKLKVLANADTVDDANKARELGAEGIGLCRTEHMFFATDRLALVRQMILGDGHDHQQRSVVLDELMGMQQGDFEKLLEVMEGLPVTIRLLDAPLHEFLPSDDDRVELRALAKALGLSARKLQDRMAGLRETNPMLGLRGCRLSLLYPDIARMQMQAVMGAVRACCDRGLKVDVGVMFPMVSCEEELVQLARLWGEVVRSGQVVEWSSGQVTEKEKGQGVRPSRVGGVLADGSGMPGSGQVGEEGSGQVIDSTARPHPNPLPEGEGTEKWSSGRVKEEGSGQGAGELGARDLELGHKPTHIKVRPSTQPPATSANSAGATGERVEGRIRIGVMIETPRAAVLAGRLARHVDFLSFGTNDLTQMTFGFSRDDLGSFLPSYLEKGLLAADPFVQLDQDGVGVLIRRAVADARAANPDIHINLCGEHGGDPASIAFANRLGLDSVSCSPLRLPVARLAASKSD